MPGILRDKYFIISASLALVLVLAWSVSDEEKENDGGHRALGIAFDIKETENGFVFSAEMSDGSSYRCFYKDRPDELGIYFFYGDFSEDSGLIFLKKMVFAEHE